MRPYRTGWVDEHVGAALVAISVPGILKFERRARGAAAPIGAREAGREARAEPGPQDENGDLGGGGPGELVLKAGRGAQWFMLPEYRGVRTARPTNSPWTRAMTRWASRRSSPTSPGEDAKIRKVVIGIAPCWNGADLSSRLSR
jgi:hypothetical protein